MPYLCYKGQVIPHILKRPSKALLNLNARFSLKITLKGLR
jgi:hypothetical protein